tara:strand:+ start:633 stop:818 length:186 start_codon:yes stop_codon:yes gene_type:complete
MATIKEMAEAHLLNVQREIQTLTQKRAELDRELNTLNEYLVEGSKTLAEPPSDDPAAEESE